MNGKKILQKLGPLAVLLMLALALAGCTGQWKYVDNTNTTTTDGGNAARDAGQAAGETGAPAPVATGGKTTDGLVWNNEMRAESGNFLMFMSCEDIAKVMGIPVSQFPLIDGQCHFRSEQPMLFMRAPVGVRLVGGKGVYHECDPVGWQSGLSARVANPNVNMVATHADANVFPEVCPLPDPVPAQPKTWPADAANNNLGNAPAAPAATAPSANNEVAAPAAPQATFNCPVHAGVQTTPVDDGRKACLWVSVPARDFGAVPNGWTAENDKGKHKAGTPLGVQGQVLLELAQ